MTTHTESNEAAAVPGAGKLQSSTSDTSAPAVACRSWFARFPAEVSETINRALASGDKLNENDMRRMRGVGKRALEIMRAAGLLGCNEDEAWRCLSTKAANALRAAGYMTPQAAREDFLDGRLDPWRYGKGHIHMRNYGRKGHDELARALGVPPRAPRGAVSTCPHCGKRLI